MANVAEQPKPSQARPGFRRVLIWSVRSGKLFALIVFGIATWLLYDALSSLRFVVRTVEAEGVSALSVDDVRTLTDATGRSIWFVGGSEIEARVRQSPYVERVQAHIMLPDRVVVQVVERRPDVRWSHDGITYALSWDGLVLAETSPVAQASAPISGTTALSDTATISGTQQSDAFVSSISIKDTTPNRQLKPGDYVDRDALEVARRVTLRAAELPVPLQRIEWDAGLGVSLIVGDNKQVVIGKSDRLDEKLAILTQLLRENTPFAYLDLRSTAPFYR